MKTSKGIVKWIELIPNLWVATSRVLQILVNANLNNSPIQSPSDERLNDWYKIYNKGDRTFSDAAKKAFIIENHKDVHLTYGFPGKKELGKTYPRLVYLCIQAYQTVQQDNKTPYSIPSPLYIIHNLLIDPDNPYTSAYSISACRDWICESLKVFPIRNEKFIAKDYLPFNKQDFKSELSSFLKYKDIKARWPDSRTIGSAGTLKSLVGMFLSIRGFTYLWFSSREMLEEFLDFKYEDIFLTPEKLEAIISAKLSSKSKNLRALYFRVSPHYENLPPVDEFINQLFGFPVPVKGMDVVLNGGLKPSSDGGLVISVSGEPGTGKTSFCLTLAQAFAPLGTTTFYLSLEETREDLLDKLQNLSPTLKSNPSIQLPTNEFFNCYDRNKSESNYNLESLKNDIVLLVDEIESATKGHNFFAGFCPAIIVIDNLNVLTGEDSNRDIQLKEIISLCRSFNAITILVSANDLPEEKRLEYLTDIAFDIKYEHLDNLNQRPVRTLNLIKSRHQVARHGSHVFHLGANKGFRVVPHMDSLMDRRELYKVMLPKRDFLIPALSSTDGSDYLKLFSRSNVLVQGYGSSGKAGFALKLLLTPPVDINNNSKEQTQRILVISFLYPLEYYKELVLAIDQKLNIKNRFGKASEIDCLTFYPGYIGPQDFLNKVVMILDTSVLDGKPYTGILIDGLHNVFLQFERLQNSHMVWAMLYNILTRHNLTTVSTFTNFSLSDDANSYSSEAVSISDQMLLQQGMTPFLHALVKSSDFFLQLQERTTHENERVYILSTKSALGQKLPKESLIWDRGGLEVIGKLTQSELEKILNGKNSV